MTSFALSDAFRVRRIRYSSKLDPLTDDMIPTERKRVSWPWNNFTVSTFHLSLFLHL